VHSLITMISVLNKVWMVMRMT